MCVCLTAVIVSLARSRAPCDQLLQRIHLALVEIGERSAYRTGRPANGVHAGLDDGDRISFAPVANVDIWQHKLIQPLQDLGVIAPADRGIEALREPGQ